MMNQQYGFSGRSGRYPAGCERSPYRASAARGSYPFGRVGGSGGCGCSGSFGSMPLPTNRDMKRCGEASCAGERTGCSPCGQVERPVPPTHGGCGCRETPGKSHAEQGGCRSGCGRSDGERPGQDRSCRERSGGERSGCSCRERSGGADDASCRKLMEQIRAVDFALYEVVLYLDVYPNSCDALETYHKLKEQREALHRQYQSVSGPLTAFGNESRAGWDWMSKPFPWEYGAE